MYNRRTDELRGAYASYKNRDQIRLNIETTGEGTSDHHQLINLDLDDHPQYLNEIRAGALFEPIIAGSTSAEVWRGDKTWYTAFDSSGAVLPGLITNTNALRFIPRSDTPTYAEGTVYYDSGDHTLNVMTDTSATTLNVGQELHIRVYNRTSATIPNGSVVFINGAQGFRPTIQLAQADTSATADCVIGIATMDITSGVGNDGWGYVTTFGLVRDVNTQGISEGTAIFLSSATPGGFTSSAPEAPYHRISIGYVVYEHPNNGIILVNIRNGEHLSELHDVKTSGNAVNEVLRWIPGNSRWQNSTLHDVYARIPTVPYASGLKDPSLFTPSYTTSARTFHLTVSSATEISIAGSVYEIPAGTSSTSAHAAQSGFWFFYYSTSGTSAVLTVTSAGWSIPNTAPIAIAWYNATTSSARLLDERHPAQTGMSDSDHYWKHVYVGSVIGSGFVLGYQTLPASGSNMRYSISEGTASDEDINYGITANPTISSADAKIINYRSGNNTSGEFTRVTSGETYQAEGVLTSAGNLLYSTLSTATNVWSLTQLTTVNRWVCYYDVWMPEMTLDGSGYQYTRQVLVGQTLHTSLANAQAEDPKNYNWGVVPQEFVIFAKRIYEYQPSMTPKFNLVQVNNPITSNRVTSIGGVVPTDHSFLTNRNALGGHSIAAVYASIDGAIPYYSSATSSMVETSSISYNPTSGLFSNRAAFGGASIRAGYLLDVQNDSSAIDATSLVGIKLPATATSGTCGFNILNDNSLLSLYYLLYGTTASGTYFGINKANTTTMNCAGGTMVLGTTNTNRLILGSNNINVMEFSTSGTYALFNKPVGFGTAPRSGYLIDLQTSSSAINANSLFGTLLPATATSGLCGFLGLNNTSTVAIYYLVYGSTAAGTIFGGNKANNATANVSGGIFYIGTVSAHSVIIGTNDATRLTITSAGIATFTSTVNAALFNASAGGITNTLRTSGTAGQVGTTTNNDLDLLRNSAVHVKLTSAGVEFTSGTSGINLNYSIKTLYLNGTSAYVSHDGTVNGLAITGNGTSSDVSLWNTDASGVHNRAAYVPHATTNFSVVGKLGVGMDATNPLDVLVSAGITVSMKASGTSAQIGTITSNNLDLLINNSVVGRIESDRIQVEGTTIPRLYSKCTSSGSSSLIGCIGAGGEDLYLRHYGSTVSSATTLLGQSVTGNGFLHLSTGNLYIGTASSANSVALVAQDMKLTWDGNSCNIARTADYTVYVTSATSSVSDDGYSSPSVMFVLSNRATSAGVTGQSVLQEFWSDGSGTNTSDRTYFGMVVSATLYRPSFVWGGRTGSATRSEWMRLDHLASDRNILYVNNVTNGVQAFLRGGTSAEGGGAGTTTDHKFSIWTNSVVTTNFTSAYTETYLPIILTSGMTEPTSAGFWADASGSVWVRNSSGSKIKLI